MRVRSISDEAVRRSWDPAVLMNWEPLLVGEEEGLRRREEEVGGGMVEEEGVRRAEPFLARRALASRAVADDEATVPSVSDAKAGREREGPVASREGPVARGRARGVLITGRGFVGAVMVAAEVVGASSGSEFLRMRISKAALMSEIDSFLSSSWVTAFSEDLRASLAAARFSRLASATSIEFSGGEACVLTKSEPCEDKKLRELLLVAIHCTLTHRYMHTLTLICSDAPARTSDAELSSSRLSSNCALNASKSFILAVAA